ncbi:DUF982 domain-containing protein [Mesorhizobium sp. M00.F.Ca.ET.186.01.1.1]|nr:DUF982 domain-containing protein [bacterium M00.F.Ca.ET.205.01.1.1]TGU50506.1 DUF982 domain-containing protein [bacterium M00.F.Ca.ET.152.01.1.1]TGV33970.1 DUF982 domain-containing protein [Mesorhizobium sp. M00.F.Ca.ET.186.01.1.1]TGZ40870.1 DUF982 domain-containing protein [bacterium M00.F.Ca.ET.162.01.1.1]
MTAFMPVTLRFCDSKTMLVGSIPQAQTALGRQWPDKAAPAYLGAARLVRLAVDGSCSQRSAFEAFTEAARQQGVLVVKPRSRAHAWLDAAASP